MPRCGWSHTVTQAEGGEQGDPFVPAFFSLGQRAALAEVQARLAPSELLLAFPDDVCVITRPDRIRSIFDMLSDALWRRAHIRLNASKTKVRNAAGHGPIFVGSRSLGALACAGGGTRALSTLSKACIFAVAQENEE